MIPSKKISDRRAFLSFLAASPVLAYAGLNAKWIDEVLAAPPQQQNEVVIKSVKEALNVFDFDAAARVKLTPAHYEFITDGSFNNETLRANREGFSKYEVRLRRLTGLTAVDQSVKLFGKQWESPIFFSPVGRMNAYYPDGAVTVAKAAKSTRTLQVLAGSAAVIVDPRGVERVVEARGEPMWIAGLGSSMDDKLLRRFEATGCPVLVWTIDDGGANTIGAKSVQRVGVRDLDREADDRCVGCHSNLPQITRITSSTPMDILGAVGALQGETSVKLNWDDVKRVRDMTKMKIVLKGIVAGEDAALCVKHGVDGIIVSNHGGHEDASGRGTIESLPEVLTGAAGKIPVLIDSGFRGGADVYKALALGATAVGIGRPHIWALSAFGQEGVETVVAILRRELQAIMAQTGAATVAQIRKDSLVPRA
ncbi:MAG TPA: alpha-hydroxy acid oxidase [Candidatus Acidoferrales bacterium]|nr:alpha-hydroxy acid oxidase [Candidatus Acidoferrales bacterium]